MGKIQNVRCFGEKVYIMSLGANVRPAHPFGERFFALELVPAKEISFVVGFHNNRAMLQIPIG